MSLFWGLNYSFLKIALQFEPPLMVLLFRVTFAALISVAFSFRSLKKLRGIGFLRPFLMSLLNISMFMSLWFIGEEYEPASISSILIYTYPIMAVLLSGPFLGEKLGLMKITGTIVGFFGLVVIFIDQLAIRGSIGLLLLVSAALMWAIGTVFYKKYLAGVDQAGINALQFIYAVPVVLLFTAVQGGVRPLNLDFLLITLYMGSFGTAVAYYIYLRLLMKYKVSHVSPYLFSVPAFSIFLSLIINGEQIMVTTLAGFLLVSAGIYISSR
jgi:drug/metabolite transporter (DMT)-like permease